MRRLNRVYLLHMKFDAIQMISHPTAYDPARNRSITISTEYCGCSCAVAMNGKKNMLRMIASIVARIKYIIPILSLNQ